MTLRIFHRLSATVVGLFIILHLANRLAGIFGQQTHIAFMAQARSVYRQPLVEIILLCAVCWQVISGILLATRYGRRGITNPQVLSGLYLSAFLIVHLSAILIGRLYLHLDTDFRFAAAGFHAGYLYLFFAPYYFLAVISVFVHLGAAFRVKPKWLSAGIGGITGFVITAMLAGWFYDVDIPASYLQIFG